MFVSAIVRFMSTSVCIQHTLNVVQCDCTNDFDICDRSNQQRVCLSSIYISNVFGSRNVFVVCAQLYFVRLRRMWNEVVVTVPAFEKLSSEQSSMFSFVANLKKRFNLLSSHVNISAKRLTSFSSFLFSFLKKC